MHNCMTARNDRIISNLATASVALIFLFSRGKAHIPAYASVRKAHQWRPWNQCAGHEVWKVHKCESSTQLEASGRKNDAGPLPSSSSSFTLEEIARELSESSYRNILVVMGAGASVNAGIPDFRTPGSLYDSLSKYNLPFPEAIFDLKYYTEVSSQPFVDLCSALWPGQDNGPRPTITHSFLKVLQDRGVLRRVYTQNIDGLESMAGVDTETLVECHGNFRSASCALCRQQVENIEACRDTVIRKEAPTCQTCGGIVKPDVVFFGEELPARFQQEIVKDVAACDLLVVIGTSLLVMPVAGIPKWVDDSHPNCPRLLLNLEPVGDFVGQQSRRQYDVFEQGNCDDGVRKLCQLAGWEEDLDQVHSATSAKLQWKHCAIRTAVNLCGCEFEE